MVRGRRIQLFGHVVRCGTDHVRALRAMIRGPPRGWRRPVGRKRQSDVTKRDHGRLAPLERWTKLGMETSAEQRPLASRRIETAMFHRGARLCCCCCCWWRRWWWWWWSLSSWCQWQSHLAYTSSSNCAFSLYNTCENSFIGIVEKLDENFFSNFAWDIIKLFCLSVKL